MRALVLGLVGVVMAAGAAEAKVCRLDQLELVAVARGSNANPELTGQHFKVVRQASRFDAPTSGTIVVEVAGKAGNFIVDQQYIPNSAPWVSAGSKAATDPGSKTNWSKRDRAREARLFEGDGTFDIYSGPLGGLTLQPTNCIEARMKAP